MNKVKNIFVAFVILGLLGCATVPPKPTTPDTGAIVIGIEKGFKGVIFIRVEDAGDDRLYKATELKLSNFSKGNCHYLLGVSPGRYAAVVALKEHTEQATAKARVTYFRALYFDQEFIKRTATEVKPNQLSVVGRFKISEKPTPIKPRRLSTLRKIQKLFVIGEGLSPEDIDYEATGVEFDKAADTAQRYYRRVFNPLNRLPLSRLADLEFYDTSQIAQKEVFNRACSDLHGSDWAEILELPSK